jgi:hypothetical protein
VQLIRLIASALLVMACAPVTPTVSPPTVPASSPTPAPSIPELGITGGAVPAGRYALRGFDPRITVDLDGSWESLAQRNGYTSLVQVSRPTGSNPYLAGTLVQITLVDSVTAERDSSIKPTTANEAVDSIKQSLESWVIETSDSRIGGLDGKQLTVEWPGELVPIHGVVGLVGGPGGAIVLSPGKRDWIAFFETEQGVVAIIVNGTIESWDAQLAAAEPVLEEIRFSVP